MRINYHNHNLSRWILPLILILVALSSTSIYLQDIHQNKDNYMTSDFQQNEALTNQMDSAVHELKIYDPEYQRKKIRAELWPGFVWKLEKNMDEHPNFNTTSSLNHELEKNNVTYYISLNPELKLKTYQPIIRSGNVTIYQETVSNKENKPNMLYIGQGWQHYIDEVLGLKAYVLYEGQGRFNTYKSTEIDSHNLEELQKYPYILLYNFKWRDEKKTEEILTEYVKSGGTLIIDASGNLEGIYYNLDNTVFLNTYITKKGIDPYPLIQPPINNSPFLSDGQTWYGANYESPYIQPIATINGKTLIGVQKIGHGKIIWIAYNLPWHAFHLQNIEEMELIQKNIGI